MYVRDDIDVKRADNFWSGAVDTINRIYEEGKLDEWETFIENYYADIGETPTITELNDLLWFESDWIYEELGISDEKESDDNSEEEDEVDE